MSGTISLSQTNETTAVTEGGASDTYTLVLDSAPTAEVTITIDATSAQVATDIITLRFTTSNWNVAQTVTVSAVNDARGEGLHYGVLQHTVTSNDTDYNGIHIAPLRVAISDDDLRNATAAFLPPDTTAFGAFTPVLAAHPAFGDLDADGDLDVLVGNYPSDFLYFQNTGSASAAIFASPQTNAFGLSYSGVAFGSPSLIDLDADGDLDLFSGNYLGEIVYFENIGSATRASFASKRFAPFGLSSFDAATAPTFADINGDGDLDAFVGTANGQIFYCENIGSAAAPSFDAATTNAFGLSNATRYAAPTFADLDGDGDLDAVVGNQYGDLLFCQNTGTATAASFAAPRNPALGLGNMGAFAKAAFADLDADGDLDALAGNFDGSVLYLENSPLLPTGSVSVTDTNLITGESCLVTITFNDTVTGFGNEDLSIANGTLSAVTSSDGGRIWTATLSPDPGIVDTTNVVTLDLRGVTNQAGNSGVGFVSSNNYTIDTLAYALTLSSTGGSTAVTEGGLTDTYTLVLSRAPSADVVITLDPTSAAVATDRTSLTFTPGNWQQPQTVTLTAVNDSAAEGLHYGVIRHLVSSDDAHYAGLDVAPLRVTVGDDDLHPRQPAFVAPVTNAFGLSLTTIDATPSFADLDADGDLDLLVGGRLGSTLYFQNTGTATAASFAAPIENPFGLIAVPFSNAAPTFADIDADGDLDALVGEVFGNTLFFRNTGTPTVASFAAPISNPFGLSDVGLSARPTFVDLDGDGQFDVVMGAQDGALRYFRNTGTATAASFAAALGNPFGLSDVGSYAAPTFADLDGDGDLDALVGNGSGNTMYFQNAGTATAASFAAQIENPFGLNSGSKTAAPALGDIDADGDFDAMEGNLFGLLRYFNNDTLPPSATVLVDDANLTVGETALVSFTFSEAVMGFSADDVQVANGTLIGLTTSNNMLWTATLTPNAALVAPTNILTLNLSGLTDSAGNAGVGTVESNPYAIDTVGLAPTLTAIPARSFADTVFDDSFLSATGVLEATDPQGDSLTYGISGGTVNGNTVSKTGTYGVLNLNLNTGAYTFTPSDAAIELTGTDSSESFTLIASDGTNTASQTLAISITHPIGASDTAGPDNLAGTAGADRFDALAGNDTVSGLAGNDTLNGGSGNDKLIGGTGNDTYVVDSVSDVVSETSTLATEIDTVLASVTFSLSANVERLTLTGSGAINGTGNTLANELTGNSGANKLSGLAGNDTLAGNAGNDQLFGGLGSDKLTGGTGSDRFVFDTTLGTSNIDTVTDFIKGSDKIVLDDDIFAKLGTGTLAGKALLAANYKVGTAAGDANDYIIYNPATDKLYYDNDGNGAHAAVQIGVITLAGTTAPALSDFLLIS